MAHFSEQTILRWIAVAGEMPEAKNFGPAVIKIIADSDNGLQSWCFDVGTKPRLLSVSVTPQATIKIVQGVDLSCDSPQVLGACGQLEYGGETEALLLWSKILCKALSVGALSAT
jgi:hypothetical protein